MNITVSDVYDIYKKVASSYNDLVDAIKTEKSSIQIPGSKKPLSIEYSDEDPIYCISSQVSNIDPDDEYGQEELASAFESDSFTVVFSFTPYLSQLAHELAHAFYYLKTGTESCRFMDDKAYLEKPTEIIAHCIQCAFGNVKTVEKIVARYTYYGLYDCSNLFLDFLETYKPALYKEYMASDGSKSNETEDYIMVGEIDSDDDDEFDDPMFDDIDNDIEDDLEDDIL